MKEYKFPPMLDNEAHLQLVNLCSEKIILNPIKEKRENLGRDEFMEFGGKYVDYWTEILLEDEEVRSIARKAYGKNDSLIYRRIRNTIFLLVIFYI